MKILISSRSFGKKDISAIGMLKNHGLEPILNPYGRKLNENELIDLIDNETIGLIAGTENITSRIMKHAVSLKVISRYGVGLDNVDLESAKRCGIIVKNTPEAPSQAVAELALGLILDLSRQISKMNHDVKSDQWRPIMGNLVSGKTIGIVGLGIIGKKLVGLLESFHGNILVCDPYPDNKFIKQHKLKLVSLKELIKKSDIISLHVSLTDKTRDIIDKKELSSMKQNVIIINTARGGLINEEALVDALEKKTIGSAAIDAFEKEPYDGRLKEFENVLLTPHVGSYAKESREKMEFETVENLLNALKEVKMI